MEYLVLILIGFWLVALYLLGYAFWARSRANHYESEYNQTKKLYLAQCGYSRGSNWTSNAMPTAPDTVHIDRSYPMGTPPEEEAGKVYEVSRENALKEQPIPKGKGKVTTQDLDVIRQAKMVKAHPEHVPVHRPGVGPLLRIHH